ncbi:MAG TPA: SoxR reducing system RseC family protein [Woeseiaceae bacterium]|nr:SoxR reducing system RseC family protein [Woeseiaceae bacterium]
MNTTTGTVLSIGAQVPGRPEREVLIAVDMDAVCSRCAAGKGCGAGLIGSSGAPRQVSASLAKGMELHPGDSVRLMLDAGSVLGAAVLAYGWPLFGALLGVGLARLFAPGDAAAALAALSGLVIGILVARSRLARGRCLEQFALKILP